ncbi:Alpha/Beta hydrolase protein [Cadophora sp. MPI-SDFR-AT-0126]|nr:Alpha/Beta hydrolase protein [Leotiomycetes sp. MPI-SDFR-AT-0126]
MNLPHYIHTSILSASPVPLSSTHPSVHPSKLSYQTVEEMSKAILTAWPRSAMQSFTTSDGVGLRYFDSGVGEAEEGSEEGKGKPWLVMIHGFTGSSLVFQRNIPSLTPYYRVIAPDLRGHGSSDKPTHGFHVSRLAADLQELIELLTFTEEEMKSRPKQEWHAIGGSLGCSILWCYASLFTTSPFKHMIFVDQSPLQNRAEDWDLTHCNRGMNSLSALLSLQQTLATDPETAHRGTIEACLAYRAFPLENDFRTEEQRAKVMREDEVFFLGEAMKGRQEWFGKLMGDHTALDWRGSIAATFGPGSKSLSKTKVLVVASERSGCFPAEGPLFVVALVNGDSGETDGKGREGERRAKGVSVGWGGHWCYWEDPERFNRLCLDFLGDREMDGSLGRWV